MSHPRKKDGPEHELRPTLPTIYDAGGSLTARWYVHFRATHPITGARVKVKRYGDINSLGSVVERAIEAEALRAAMVEALARGWSPFTRRLKATRELTFA